MAAIPTLMYLPEYILYRYRDAYSILELNTERPLEPFDYRTFDGLTLRSWYVPPRDGHPTIVYFPGRDGDIIRKPAHLVGPAEAGYGLLLVGYRGYGGNPGAPDELAMQRDMLALLRQAEEAGLTPDGTILYGYSMGTAFAAHAAANSDPIAVVLEAPLSTFLAAVRQQVAYVPDFLVRTRFNNLARLKEIEAPILLLAGGEDSVTPPAFAHALAAANPEFATVKVVPGASHLNIIRSGGRAALAGFLSRFADHQKVITMPLKQS